MRLVPPTAIFLTATLAVLSLLGSGWSQDAPGKKGSAKASGPERLEGRGIENLYRLTPRVYSSGGPEKDADFAALAKLGVKTIISVDGAIPNIETAKKHGIRYIHLPMGYGGVPKEEGLRVASAIERSPGPVLIHCHHGKHRGPAAAAVGCIASEGWTNAQAVAWLRQAGTSPDYRQLFADVAAFRPPSRSELERAGPLPEKVDPPPLVEGMVAIDALFDQLKAAEKSGWKTLDEKALAATAHASLQLEELFRELARSAALKDKPADFAVQLKLSADRAKGLHSLLAAPVDDQDSDSVTKRGKGLAIHLAGIARSCTECHAKYRDVAAK